MTLAQSVRDRIAYSSGYFHASVPASWSDTYALLASKLTSLLALPLPLLSLLALPIFGGSSTFFSISFFYLTFVALVFSHGALGVELWGTLVVRVLFFLLPALASLVLDVAAPRLSAGVKTQGAAAAPSLLTRRDRRRLLAVVGVAVGNVVLAVLVQGALELLCTRVLRLRSLLRFSTFSPPLPWNVVKDLLKGFFCRGLIHYVTHRYVCHEQASPLQTWHQQWQHSLKLPFSLVAAYDHPATHLLTEWLPAFLPACLFRFHLITWLLFQALCSLEALLLHSGYSVLPSNIILPGMARRCDEHFLSVHDNNRAVGNFGRWGVLDLALGTTGHDEDTLVDDMADAADKHEVKERTRGALKGAKKGLTQSKSR